ncbi:MAG: OmpA family protein [Cytophagaceae bacterium]
MRRYFKILTLLFILFFPLIVSAQNYTSTNKKAIKLFEEADYYLKGRQFDPAIKGFYAALEKDPQFVEAHLKLAGIYKQYAELDKAKVHLLKAVEIRPDDIKFYTAYYLAGELSFNDGEYENALKYFRMVASLNPNDKNILEMVPKYIYKAESAIEMKKNPVPFNPVPMSSKINKFYLHGYPVLTADQEMIIFYKRNSLNLTDDEDIYYSKKVNGEWTDPASISDNINTQFNEGAPTMSADGKVLVFSSCNRKDGLGACDLYISYRQGNDWTKPVNMGPNVNSNVWDSEPSISADGKTIYFASERKGGYGKDDIWYTTQDEKGEWTPAKNVGKPVNTEGREVSPFIHANGTSLYFASTSHKGMGGLDLFISRKTNDGWTQPENLGYPINTHSNDATLFITADSKKGYYTVYDKKDMRTSKALIYEFDVPPSLQEKNKSTYAKGRVFDSESKNPLDAQIELVDINSGNIVNLVSSDKVFGDYLIVLTEGKEYALYVRRDGYLPKSTYFNYVTPAAFDPLLLDIYIDPVKPGMSAILNNIFFKSGSAELEDKSLSELKRLAEFMKVNINSKIEIGGHTDDIGSDKDNQILSEKRAKSVYEYLVSSGISAQRLKYKGYGESSPKVANTSDENRQLNRRIEFKVL